MSTIWLVLDQIQLFVFRILLHILNMMRVNAYFSIFENLINFVHRLSFYNTVEKLKILFEEKHLKMI